MSARIPPGFAEVWTQYVLSTDPEPMYTSLGVDLAVGVGATQTDADALLGAVRTSIVALITNNYVLGPGHVIFGQDGGDIRIDGSLANLTGTGTGSASSQNTALLVRKLTALGGRRNRGRLFMPGINEANVDPNGQITAGTFGGYVTGWNNVRTAIIALAQADDVVVFHDTAPFTPTVVTALTAQQTVATQRRRLRH